MWDIYTIVYDVRDMIFTYQIGKFPHRSLSGNNYLMVLVEIDSSAILVEPIRTTPTLNSPVPTPRSCLANTKQASPHASMSSTTKYP